MSLSQTRDQQSRQDGSSASAAPSTAEDSAKPQNNPRLRPPTHRSSPENPSFTSFPEGEGATNPDIPSEPMLNKLYNKVLSLTSSAKSPTLPFVQQQPHQQYQPVPEFKSKTQEKVKNQDGGAGLGISFGESQQTEGPSVISITTTESKFEQKPVILPQSQEMSTTTKRQSIMKAPEKSPDILQPVLSAVNATGGLTRSEDEISNVSSEKAATEITKQSTKSNRKEINLPGLAGFRLSREPSSDSESVSSYSVHPGRTLKSIVGRLKTGDLGREFWMKDESSHECFLCGEKFTTFRRKHHCRICGRIFDDDCTSFIPGARFGTQQTIRVCKTCKNLMDEYDDLAEQDNTSLALQPSLTQADAPPVSLTVIPPSEATSEDPQSLSEHASPQVGYTLPAGRKPGTVPQMAIPATRTAIGTSGRHTAVELPTIDTTAARPQSSRSNTGIQIGRRRSTSFNRPRSGSIPQEEAYFRAPFHQNNMNDDEMLSQDTPDDSEIPLDDFSVDDIYAPRSTKREGTDPTQDASQYDHLKPPTPVQRHRSLTKSAFEERLRTSKRRSLQSISRRTRSKSRSHRGSTSFSGDYFRDAPFSPSSPVTPLGAGIMQPTSPATPGDMNQTSISHLQRLLTQMLVDESIPNVEKWEQALMPILLKIADTLDPDVHGMGDDIDVRSYVKIKRLPGGTEADTTYVSGVVFTKNLALRRMTRTIANPRIMLVTFPVEYHHSEMQLMSLDPMIAQGKEYIRNLVIRIVSHKPSVLVIGNSVSGLALDYLLEYGVSTLYNVKPSVIGAISRCCEADIISSIDKLSSNPELGTCGQFSVRTSVHDLIPGRKKTLVYLNGCPQDLGCTVVLRGADMETLSRVKRVLDFMVYVAYNLKLETSLMYDNMINIPTSLDIPEGEENQSKEASMEKSQEVDTSFYDTEIQSIQKIILSASPFVKFPAPELILKARDAEIRANKLRREHEEARKREEETLKEEPAIPDESKPVSTEPEQESSEKKECSQTTQSEIKQIPYQVRVENLLHEYRHNCAIHDLQRKHKQWETFKQQNPELMNPLAHQNIILLYSNLQRKTSVPCQGPDIHTIDFYQESDCTLGQYVEDLFLHKEVPCDECEKMQHEHVRNYVHNNGRMNVFIEKLPCPLPGLQKSILMWSWCSVCEQTLNVSRMSENSYRYSFGKWLELAFYAQGLKHRGGVCPHDVNRHHVRYFGYDNWVVRFQYDSVDVLDLVVPDMRLTWEPENDVRLKAEEKAAIAVSIDRFFESVNERWKAISLDNIAAEKQDPCKAEISQALSKTQSQREAALNNLERVWNDSMVLDRLPLNRILRDLQESVVYWDAQFSEFERNYMPSDKDIRRLTALQLRKLVGDASIPFIDVLEKRGSVSSTGDQSSDSKTGGEPSSSEKAKGTEPPTDATSPPEISEPVPETGPSDAIDVPGKQSKPEEHARSPSTHPSSVESHISEVSATESDRRVGSAPKTLSVAPKIARLQADLISPANSPLRKPIPKSSTSTSISSQSPPERARNPSVQSSESDDGPSPTDIRRPPSTPRPIAPTSKIPKPKPPQPLTTLHGKHKNTETSDSRHHKSRNPGEDSSSRSKPKQFMSNTIKKLQRAGGGSSVSNLAKHFDELSRQYEKEEIRRRKRFGYRRVLPVTSAKPKVEVFKSVQDAVLEASDEEVTSEVETPSAGHSRTSTMKGSEEIPEALRFESKGDSASVKSGESETAKAEPPTEAAPEDFPVGPSEVVGDIVSEITESQEAVKVPPEGVVIPSEETKESISLMKAISSLWADRSSALWKPLDYPLQPSAHIFSDSDVIVREDEPSSLIAFTLSSQDYEAKLKAIKQSDPPAAPPVLVTDTPETSKPGSRDGDREQASETQSLTPANDIEAALLRTTGTHLKYQFQEGSANFFCKIFYAEQFDALRINCGCDEHYIQSLSRCLKWDSSGGKSKSAFLKTLDDRFVVKQMSRSEMDSFVKLAPFYFEYMSQAFFHELPTVLAKILGFYQIGSKNPMTGKTMKMDVLVMENLFYERKTSRIFDLKGSMRNRHVQSTGKENEVLLDENLVEFIYESPLFVGQLSKRALRHSLWNDTLLLAKMNVMDYSLVIGIDEENKELILGIIDFIRTFTWDKKLESWVKERGLVGGGTKEPTIVTPRQYKNRFRASMERYFLQVPNCYSIQDTRRA